MCRMTTLICRVIYFSINVEFVHKLRLFSIYFEGRFRIDLRGYEVINNVGFQGDCFTFKHCVGTNAYFVLWNAFGTDLALGGSKFGLVNTEFIGCV